MVNGPLFSKIVLFAVPLMFSGMLQLLFNAADIIVVGRFCGKEAIAAVGATASTINLIVCVCIGFTVGTNVLVAQFYGAKKEGTVGITVHTSITFSVIAGTIMMLIGLLASRGLLTLLGTPEDVIELSLLYMRIYLAGLPVLFLYNFGAAVLRAIGDTFRPMIFLTISGVLNVILNLLFVIVFDMNVAGVGLATVLSEALSAFLVILCLIRSDDIYRFELRRIGINPRALKEIVHIGLPASLQSAVFSISNMQIQSSVNSFGSAVMAGHAAANNISGFVYTAMNSVTQASITFTSQNFGAGKFKRLNKVLINCVIVVSMIGGVLGGATQLFGEPLLRIYTTDPDAISAGMIRFVYFGVPYLMCGVMEVICGAVRGIGYEFLPMIVSLIGACGFRVFWVSVIFHAFPTLQVLYISYPISWILTGTVHLVCYIVCKRKMIRLRTARDLGRRKPEAAAQAAEE